MQFTEQEINAVKYYIGDCAGFEQDDFWSDTKAYNVINSLFYSGIATEQARANEGKFLNPAIVSDIERLEKLLTNLLSACKKSKTTESIQTYRVERFLDYQAIKQAGKTISFTSTSKSYFLKSYQDRAGIALMRFVIPAGTPCIDMQKFFDNYAKSEETEVLLPPNLSLQIAEVPVSESELTILDANHQPPIISCIATVQNIIKPDIQEIPKLPENSEIIAKNTLTLLNQHEKIPFLDYKKYSEWKRILINRIFCRYFS
ncbi:MAG: hypothetical protein K2G88_04485 [Oscillospiraceae bacterium]|nr:hypothetical protein [Oscillospiraceae bacterium]